MVQSKTVLKEQLEPCKRMKKIRIATRNSPLALWQANYVKDLLLDLHQDLQVELVPMTTRGDQMLDRSLSTIGGKGLFLKELETALLEGKADIAVHSMKDVPVSLPEGLEIPVVLEREDPRDAFVSNDYQNLYALPDGARVGTSSLRRVSQLKNAFPQLQFSELRGNVNTRLKKLDAGEFDAIILAAAGLIRLGMKDRIGQYIAPTLCIPAVGQGIVGIECRIADANTYLLIEPLNNKSSELVLSAERALNQGLQGGCSVPIAGYAEVDKGKLTLNAMVGAPDGSKVLKVSESHVTPAVNVAVSLGRSAASDLLGQGAGEILSALHGGKLSTKPVVLLTRQYQLLANMPAILKRLDFDAVNIPTLQVAPTRHIAEQLADIESYTDVVFVSRNSVDIGMKILSKTGGIPESVQAMAVGAETAKHLMEYGVEALYPNMGAGAQALLDVAQLKELKGRKILIIRGKQGLDWPAEEMRARGAQVNEAICYRQFIPENSEQNLKDALEQISNLHCVFVHSSNSLRNLIKIAGKNKYVILNSMLVAGSKNIAEVAIGHGWLGEVHIAESPSNNHMMLAFSQH